MASLKNKAGNFITPSLESTSAAAEGAEFPEDLRFSVANSANADAYPIVGATWILAYDKMTDAAKAAALKAWLTWSLERRHRHRRGPRVRAPARRPQGPGPGQGECDRQQIAPPPSRGLSLPGGGRQTPHRGSGGARESAAGPTPSSPSSRLSAACWYSWCWPTWSSPPPAPRCRSSARRASPSSPAPTGTRATGSSAALPFIYGTIVTSVIALIIAVPLSMGVALFSHRVRAQAAARPHRVRGGPAGGRAQRHLRALGSLRAAAAVPAAGGRLPGQVPGLHPHLRGAGLRALVLRRRHHPRHHDHAHHHLAHAGRCSARCPPPTGTPPTRWGPPGGR